MGKYDDIKNKSDAALFEEKEKKRRMEEELHEKYNAALNSCHHHVLNELMDIGKTFLSGRFFLRKGYRVEHFRARDGSLVYLWELQHQIDNGTRNWYGVVCVRLSLRYPAQFCLHIDPDYGTLQTDYVEKSQSAIIIVKLKEFLAQLNSNIS
jgi:hypothetical protein